ncbi:acyloxyacyl hydrolase [Massilia solisilvae]|uniref:Lipid A deacylase n=2 Tax=Massilia TaxID=149698 RepID=A0ABT2BKP8_9BURK|nr:acyloxyacyl hydrolase [Massilia solisilvae]MCS0609074.1 acyloxyacyl hydrolase [Massilia solisilvae]
MVSIRKVAKSVAALAALMVSHASFAGDGLDSYSLELGAGDQVGMVRAAVQKDWNVQWFASNGRHLGGYWDANIAFWRGTDYRHVSGQNQNLWVIGVTPVFRYQNDNKLGWYAEGGIGASLFSELYNNAGNRLSTAYEFADHIGVGYVLDNKWDISARIQHYSNGGIKHPNSGVNWAVLRVARPF